MKHRILALILILACLLPSAALAESVFPLEEPVTFTVAYNKRVDSSAFAEMDFFKRAEEDTGVIVEWIEWPSASLAGHHPGAWHTFQHRSDFLRVPGVPGAAGRSH